MWIELQMMEFAVSLDYVYFASDWRAMRVMCRSPIMTKFASVNVWLKLIIPSEKVIYRGVALKYPDRFQKLSLRDNILGYVSVTSNYGVTR